MSPEELMARLTDAGEVRVDVPSEIILHLPNGRTFSVQYPRGRIWVTKVGDKITIHRDDLRKDVDRFTSLC